MYTPYEIVKFWLPVASAFGLVIKAYTSTKASVTEFAERLLNNHLSGIEKATQSTEVETKKTNDLLSGHSGKLDRVQATLADHQTKNLEVWQGVLTQLAVIKERTRACGPKTPSKRKGRNG